VTKVWKTAEAFIELNFAGDIDIETSIKREIWNLF
jgi:hypothetical protein